MRDDDAKKPASQPFPSGGGAGRPAPGGLAEFIRKTKKIRLTLLLLILLVCLGVLMHKRRIEFSLIEDGSKLSSALWNLLGYLPPGDAEPANTPRRLDLTLDRNGEAVRLKADFKFDQPYTPWPSRVTLDYHPVSDRTQEKRTFVLSPPFHQGEPSLQLLTASGWREADAGDRLMVLADLNSIARNYDRKEPKLSPFQWQDAAPGLQTATAYMRYGPRLGGRELHLLRFDPAKFSFKPWHENEFGPQPESGRMNIRGWAAKLPSATALINGGQYETDRAYIGWLARDGKYLSDKPKRGWSGYFVSGPGPKAPAASPPATIIDVEERGRKLDPGVYRNIGQSLMLLDAGGKIRVRNSFHLAGRAALGEARDGRIWFIMTPNAISLHDLALTLKDPSLGLKRVLCLDGGFEAQLMWRKVDGGEFSDLARYLVFPDETFYSPDMGRSLPSVIAAVPVEAGP